MASDGLYQAVVPDLLELCATHRLDTGMVENSQDMHELLDRVLEEYGRRLKMLRAAGPAEAATTPGTADRLGALVHFARGAVALEEGEASAAELQRRAMELERLNEEIDNALREVDRSSKRVDHVLGSFDDRLRAARRKHKGGQGEGWPRERLERLFQALGVLGHKINNPLTALMGRAQILQFKKSGDPHVAKAGEVIEESAKRIASYVRELVQVVREGREDLLGNGSDGAAPETPEHEAEHEGED